MSERQDDQGRSRRPISTGEFRAAPDISASTAQFRRFAEAGVEPERAWDMAAPRRNVARMAMLVVGVALALAIIAILVVTLA